MNYFKPLRKDGLSARDVAFDLLKDKPPGTVIPYAIFGAALGTNDRVKVQQAVRAATKLLLKRSKRGVVNVPNSGYRILPANENITIARRHETKSDKALVRALDFYEGTNLTEMSDAERRLHQGQHMIAIAIMASHRHINKRLDRIEDLIGGGKPPVE